VLQPVIALVELVYYEA